jgi:hypothetical protein
MSRPIHHFIPLLLISSVILLLSSVMFAGMVAYQTDWLGGPGVTGPVTDFENTFLSSSMIDFTSEVGKIFLSPETMSNLETDLAGCSPSVVYPDSGFLISSIYDTQQSFSPWSYLHFSTTLPQSTSIGIRLRVSEDYNDMGPWSEIFMYPRSLVGIFPTSANYVQYMAVLYTANPDTTPALKDVDILYFTGAIDELCAPVSQSSMYITANPSVGPVEAVINLLSPASVEILVFDLSGRLAKEALVIDCESGRQTAELGEFQPGVYNVLLRSGEFSSLQRFAVVQ